VFKELNDQGSYPNAELFERSTFVLPIYPELSETDKEHIVKSVKKIAERYQG